MYFKSVTVIIMLKLDPVLKKKKNTHVVVVTITDQKGQFVSEE